MVTFVNLNPVNTEATDICILLCLTNAAHFVNLFKTFALQLFFIYSLQYFCLSSSHFLVTGTKMYCVTILQFHTKTLFTFSLNTHFRMIIMYNIYNKNTKISFKSLQQMKSWYTTCILLLFNTTVKLIHLHHSAIKHIRYGIFPCSS
jgi:hypothetical protein